MKENKFLKGLISNTAIIGVGSAFSKLLIFFLVPILTRELSTEEYGLSELITSSVDLAIPIFTIVIYEAILRFTIDNSNDKKEVLAVGIRVTLFGILFMIPLLLIVSLFYTNYYVLTSFLFIYVMLSIKDSFVYYARGENKFSIVTIISVIEGTVLLLFVLIFVCAFNQGLKGYIQGMIISKLIANVLYCILLHINIFSVIKIRNITLEKNMIKYSVPMIFNSIGWWINNLSDRYIVTLFCGVSLTGIYSVSYKIPGVLNTIIDVFMQAWKISATEEYDKGKTYHYNKGYVLFVISGIFISSILICLSKICSSILFDIEYINSWKYTVVLIVAFLFHGISGYLGTIFTAAKQTKYIAYTTIVGAIINIILNFALIPSYEAFGAAIATLVSNIIIWGVRSYFVNKYVKIDIFNFPIMILFGGLFMECYFVLNEQNFLMGLLNTIVICSICFVNLLAHYKNRNKGT